MTGTVDSDRTLGSRDTFAANWDDKHQVQWVDSIGADLSRGQARLVGERSLEVDRADGQTLTLHAAKAIVVATDRGL